MELSDYMKKHPFSESDGYNNRARQQISWLFLAPTFVALFTWDRYMSLVRFSRIQSTIQSTILLFHYSNCSFNITLSYFQNSYNLSDLLDFILKLCMKFSCLCLSHLNVLNLISLMFVVEQISLSFSLWNFFIFYSFLPS